MRQSILLFGVLALTATPGRTAADPFAEDLLDSLILVAEGTPDTLALVDMVDGTLGDDFIEANFQEMRLIQVVLSDESPEDGEGGAAFFPAGSNFAVTYEDGTEDGDFPVAIEGGFFRPGFIAADGLEQIHLLYDLDAPWFVTDDTALREDITRIEIQLMLGNHYRLKVYLATESGATAEPVRTARTPENILDLSNLAVIRIVLADSDGNATSVGENSWGRVKTPAGLLRDGTEATQ